MKKYFPLIVLLLLSYIAQPKAIHVGGGYAVRDIKQAIKSAANGDTIYVHAGTYREGNIIVEKSIHLIGVDNPVLDGEHKYEIFTIHANDVTIQGLRFIDTGIASINDLAAIKVLDSRRIHVRDNQFNDTFFGIYFANSSESIIENNVLKATGTAEHEIGNGIHMWKCNKITIRGNNIQGHRDGIYFEFVTNSFIENNVSQENLRYGLHFMFSHDDEYRHNSFIRNGAGVAVMYTKGVKMINNIFEHNWGPASYGLLLKDIRDSHVNENQFIQNSIGIFMEGSSRIEFRENAFESNGYAIRLQASCDDNKFSRNNFKGNTFDLATNGSLVLNTIDGNYWDRYDGYDLDRDGTGDVPYRPVSMYAMVVERMPTAVLLWRSFLVFLLDRAEKAIPVITPENLKDEHPQMKAYDLSKRTL
jgi:nitrous oxidase accessory protein